MEQRDAGPIVRIGELLGALASALVVTNPGIGLVYLALAGIGTVVLLSVMPFGP